MAETAPGPIAASFPPGTRVLVAEDDPLTLMLLKASCDEWGLVTTTTDNGEEALEVLSESDPPRLALLDWEMPGMDGPEVVAAIRKNPDIPYVYAILLTGRSTTDDLVAGLASGADDYIHKPFEPEELRARLMAGERISSLQARLRAQNALIEEKNRENERLLCNIMPGPIAERLRRGEEPIIDRYALVTVLFADLEGFTDLAARIDAQELVGILNNLFNDFDEAATRWGVEKIKTLGDGYMAACGLPEPNDKHTESVVEMALEMLQAVDRFNENRDKAAGLALRVGIHTGPVLAGVLGKQKFTYDLWGDTVNTASRMEAFGRSGQMHLSAPAYERIKHLYRATSGQTMQIKGKGEMETYLLGPQCRI